MKVWIIGKLIESYWNLKKKDSKSVPCLLWRTRDLITRTHTRNYIVFCDKNTGTDLLFLK